MRLPDEQLHAWRQFLNAHALMIRVIEREMHEAGLPPLSWYDVLWALHRSPRRRLRVHQLADELVLSRSGLSRLTERIESAGYLERRPVEGDRRGAFLVLTREGGQALRRMWPVYARVIEQHFGAPVGTRRDDLAQALADVAASARQELSTEATGSEGA